MQNLKTGEHERPLISVLISLFNGAATLDRAVESVLCQNYTNRELIVMDGGSTDGGVELLRRLGPSISYWESQPDRGIYHALNKALAKARGEWIYVLGADDFLWDETVFARISGHLRKAFPEYRVVYGRANFMSASGEILEILGEPWEVFRRRFLQGFMIPHQAVFHHRSLFEVHGSFDESFRTGADYEILLRELRTGPALFVPDVIIAGYQFGGRSSAPRNTLLVLKERRRARKLNGVGSPGLLWYLAEMRALLRAALWAVLGERLAKRVLDIGRAILGKPPLWTRI
jgi:glycosyltransferase involved in cell wall biosynthesis